MAARPSARAVQGPVGSDEQFHCLVCGFDFEACAAAPFGGCAAVQKATPSKRPEGVTDRTIDQGAERDSSPDHGLPRFRGAHLCSEQAFSRVEELLRDFDVLRTRGAPVLRAQGELHTSKLGVGVRSPRAAARPDAVRV